MKALVNSTFPAIKATEGVALSFVGPKTVVYIHALIVDSVTMLQVDSPNNEAIRNEVMIRQELATMNPAVMRKQLHRCFVIYYEDILKVLGASGSPTVPVFKRKFKQEESAFDEEQGDPVEGDAHSEMGAAWTDDAGGGQQEVPNTGQ
jgi:hypothetical protein